MLRSDLNYTYNYLYKFQKIPLRLKAKVYEAIIRPARTYGSESWAMKVNNKRKIATTEMRMLRGIFGVLRLDHMRKEEI